jgi:uncharacterized protein YdaU (DUF1376 family)
MNYYSHHIGDYRRNTGHLTNDEDLAYRRLIEMYYDTELPIPLETQWVSRRLRLGLEIVESVLKDFFLKQDDGWHHARCEQEIEEYRKMQQKNSTNGKKGGRPKGKKSRVKNPNKTDSKPTGFPLETDSKPTGKLTKNQEPRTNNQEPKEERELNGSEYAFCANESNAGTLQKAVVQENLTTHPKADSCHQNTPSAMLVLPDEQKPTSANLERNSAMPPARSHPLNLNLSLNDHLHGQPSREIEPLVSESTALAWAMTPNGAGPIHPDPKEIKEIVTSWHLSRCSAGWLHNGNPIIKWQDNLRLFARNWKRNQDDKAQRSTKTPYHQREAASTGLLDEKVGSTTRRV